MAPDRVGRAVLEAPPLLAVDFSQDILANYLPPLIPDKWGLHVQQAWNMRRDMFLFWPWYRQQRDAVRPSACRTMRRCTTGPSACSRAAAPMTSAIGLRSNTRQRSDFRG